MMKPLAIYTTPPDATCTLVHDDGPTFVAVDGIGANGRPGHIFSIDGVGDGHGARLTVEKVGFATVNQRGTLWLSRPGSFAEFDVDDVILNPRQEAPPLQVRGHFFALADGRPWTIIEASDFNLYGRYLTEGADAIQPVLAQRQECGFNTLRVWTLYDVPGIGHLLPSEHPDFYARLPDFLALCGAYGLHVELTVFTGTKRLMPSRAAQQAHLDQICSAVRAFNGPLPNQTSRTLIEVGNEWNEGDNAWFLDLRYPTDLLLAAGSVGSDTWPTELGLPVLQYQTWHGNDTDEWQRKSGREPQLMAEAQGGTAISNENTRYTDRDASLGHAQGAAESAALLGGGSCYHSINGKLSLPWVGVELEAAKVWAASARKVPLEFQQGRYNHATNLEPPGVLRAYQRILGDGRAYTALVPV